jgi:hypothetical protein
MVSVGQWRRMGQPRTCEGEDSLSIHSTHLPFSFLNLILLPWNPISSKYFRPGPILNPLHGLISGHCAVSRHRSIGSRVPTLVVDFDYWNQGTRDGC